MSGKYEHFKTDLIDEVITWDLDGLVNLFTQLQIIDFLYVVCRNIILQCFLSLIFDFLQMFTTNHSINKVNKLYFFNLVHLK